MARTDTLGNFLTDVADSIREKKGTSEPILASDFDTEIASIESGGDLSEYFYDTITQNTNTMPTRVVLQIIKKLPDVIYVDNSVTNLTGAFDSSKLTTLPKLVFGSNVTTISSMFNYCKASEIDVTGFNTSNITAFTNLFSDCSNLLKVDTSISDNFVSDKVTTMYNMFNYCTKMTEANLSNLRTPVLADTSYMFYNCRALQKIDIRNMTFDNVTNHDYMLDSVPRNCEIIVKSDTEKQWFATNFSSYTNVKTVAEL